MVNKISVWHVAREYAGLAESGGVKNVVKGLCEAMTHLGHQVSAILPFYGFMEKLELNIEEALVGFVKLGHQNVELTIKKIFINNVTIYMVDSPCFKDKEDPYVEPESGIGYADSLYMNVVLAKAVIFLTNQLECPDIIHLHDAHTALLSVMMPKTEDRPKFVLTIHNAGVAYQERYRSAEEVAWFSGISLDELQQTMIEGLVNPLALASLNARLTTVSPAYAEDLVKGVDNEMHGLSAFLKNHHIEIRGIYNGIDIAFWKTLGNQYYPMLGRWQAKDRIKRIVLADNGGPKDHTKKYGHFIVKPNWPLYFFHSRLVEQKGVSILIASIKLLLAQKIKAQFLIIGQGSLYFTQQLLKLATESDGKVVFINDYDDTMVQRAWAASDFFLVPSVFEPCGLTDLYAVMLGSVPIVHNTGGLAKVADYEMGFFVDDLSAEIFSGQISEVNGIYLNNKKVIRYIALKAHYFCAKFFNWVRITKNYYEPFYFEVLRPKDSE